jgi:hypothetical protein
VARFAAVGAAIVLTDVHGAAARQIAGETGATIYPFTAAVSVEAKYYILSVRAFLELI